MMQIGVEWVFPDHFVVGLICQEPSYALGACTYMLRDYVPPSTNLERHWGVMYATRTVHTLVT